MVTFAFEVNTDDGSGTVHTDEMEQFLESFAVEVAFKQPATLVNEDQTFILPILVGYNGPHLMGRSPTGDQIIGYEERV